jgi:hypothetical protein
MAVPLAWAGEGCQSALERVGEREHHRDTDADKECGVNQAGQQVLSASPQSLSVGTSL